MLGSHVKWEFPHYNGINCCIFVSILDHDCHTTTLHTLLLIIMIATPKFGDLIDLLEEAEDCSPASGKSVSEVLYSLF